MAIQILVVDDEKSILMLIKNALQKEGYIVTCISDSAEVEVNLLTRYDLILLDIMMPGKDGCTLCSEIRDKVDCPILFLTAKTEEEDVVKGLGVGADDYMKKPFGIGELRARIQAHLRREHRERRHIISVDGVRFLLDEKRVVFHNNELPFTKSEFAICEYLATHRGQVFSKERIYEYVFGFDGESDSSAITEHIKNIRAKCAKVELAPIETVWGIGYKWR